MTYTAKQNQQYPTIRLRAVEPEDLDLMYRIENDTRFWRYSSTTVPYSRFALREYISSSQNDIFADGQVRMVIESVMENEDSTKTTAIGFADLFNFDAKHLRAEIGLFILPENQGNHYGHSILEALCNYAQSLYLHQIYAIIATTNEPATQLFSHFGFNASALLHDWLRLEDGFVDAVVWQRCLSASPTTM